MWNFESESNDVEQSEHVETNVGEKRNKLREVSLGNKKSTDRNTRRKNVMLRRMSQKNCKLGKNNRLKKRLLLLHVMIRYFTQKGIPYVCHHYSNVQTC